nr:hypothetical protein [Tanacetum cinerariifolium]
MHNTRKTVSELHALLIEYEKCLPKIADTLLVLAIKSDRIQKANNKSLNAKGKGKGKDKPVYIPKLKNLNPSGKEHQEKDDNCHYCKEVLRGERKLKQGALYSYVGNGVCSQVEDIRSYDLILPNANTLLVLAIKSDRIQKANNKSLNAKGKGKGKDKPVYIPKLKNLNPSGKEHQEKDDNCHYCKEVGY